MELGPAAVKALVNLILTWWGQFDMLFKGQIYLKSMIYVLGTRRVQFCRWKWEQALEFNIQNIRFEDRVVKDLSGPKSEMSGMNTTNRSRSSLWTFGIFFAANAVCPSCPSKRAFVENRPSNARLFVI